MARPSLDFTNAATTSVFDDAAIDFARSWLSGYYYDYALFHNDDDYCLVLGSSIRGNRYSYSMSPSPSGAFTFIVYQVDDTTGAISYQYYYDITDYDITISSTYTMYSSLPDMPDLVAGGDKYAFAQVCCMVVLMLFLLLDRVFRHIR